MSRSVRFPAPGNKSRGHGTNKTRLSRTHRDEGKKFTTATPRGLDLTNSDVLVATRPSINIKTYKSFAYEHSLTCLLRDRADYITAQTTIRFGRIPPPRASRIEVRKLLQMRRISRSFLIWTYLYSFFLNSTVELEYHWLSIVDKDMVNNWVILQRSLKQV